MFCVLPLHVSQVRAKSEQLVVLASRQEDPGGIAVSNGYVYWTDGHKGTISKVQVEGGNVTIIARAGREPLRVAVEGDYVYWTDFLLGTVTRVRVEGGPVKVLASGQDHPLHILVRDGYVYWAEALQGNVKRIHVDGSGPIEAILTGRIGVSGFAIDDNGYLYWAEGSIQGADVSRIGRISLPGGQPRLFVKTIKPWSLTIRAGYLFWTEYRWGGVFKAPLAGGAIDTVKIPASEDDDFLITSDDLNVYWTSKLTGTVQSAPVRGGAVTVLAANRTGPYDVASDGTHIVWTEEGGGNVMLYRLSQQAGVTVEMIIVPVAAAIFVFGVAIGVRHYRHSMKKRAVDDLSANLQFEQYR